MTAPIDFVAPVLSCISIDFDWPDIDLPGFPTLVLGCFGSLFAGINLILPFIPPDIDNLPSFSIPDINIFLDAFFNIAIGIPSFPSININLPSFGLTIPLPNFSGFELPDMPEFPWGQMPNFDPTAMLKLIAMLIALPFLIIQYILDSILALSLEIPDFDFVLDLLIDIGLDLGFSLPTINLFSSCLATGIMSMIDALL